MQTESLFIAHPTDNEQINVLKTLLKVLKIKFEIKTTKVDEQYNPEFVAKIKLSQEDFKNGRYSAVKLEDLNSYIANL